MRKPVSGNLHQNPCYIEQHSEGVCVYSDVYFVFFSLRDDLKSPRQPNDDQSEGFDELATVGYPEETDVSTVIEPSGMHICIIVASLYFKRNNFPCQNCVVESQVAGKTTGHRFSSVHQLELGILRNSSGWYRWNNWAIGHSISKLYFQIHGCGSSQFFISW